MKYRGFSVFILFIYLFLFLFNSPMSRAQQQQSLYFNLNCYRTFTETDNVEVQLNFYYNYDAGRSANQAVFQMALYEATSEQFLNESFFMQSQLIDDELLSKMKLVKTWEQNFSDYNYQPLSVGKLPQGVYVLEAVAGGRNAAIPIIVSHYTLITQALGNEMLASLADNGGNIRRDFSVYVPLNGEKKLSEIKAKNGVAFVKLPQKDNQYHSALPVLAIADGKLSVSQSYFDYYYQRQQSHRQYIFTDRSAYRPTQTVLFKGILRDKESMGYVVPKGKFVYKITDPNGSEVAKKEVELSADGTFNDEFQLTQDAALGNYYIDIYPAALQEDQRYPWYYNYNIQRAGFLVEEYKKPEYEVLVELDKPQYVSGDVLKAEICAKYFFGAPVTNAEVNYKIIREQLYTPWYWRCAYAWWYEDYYPYYREREIVHSGNGNIDEQGCFYVTYNTDAQTTQNYRYTIIAEITDASRRTISGSASATVANTEFTVSAQSEKYYYKPNDMVRVIVAAADYNQKPVQTDIYARVYAQDYNRGYSNKRLVTTQNVSTNAATGEAVVEFKANESGYYTIEVEAKDSRGKLTTATAYAYILGENDNFAWWQQNGAQIQVLTDKKVYNAGEQVQAMIFVPQAADAVITLSSDAFHHYEVYTFKKDKNADTNGGAREIFFDIAPHIYGKLNIAVALYQNGQLQFGQEQITIIPQQQYLNVEIVFNESDYRPATTAEATVRVTDANGKPVPNADVALATADESLFFLYPDNTPDIRKVFYDAQQQRYVNTNANQYNYYSNSNWLSPFGLEWRKLKWKKNDFNAAMYLSKNEWYRLAAVYYGAEPKNEDLLVSGYVLHKDSGLPITNADVLVGDTHTVTNAQGAYTIKLDMKKAVSEEYNLTAKASYKNQHTILQNIKITPNVKAVLLNIAVDDKNNKEFKEDIYISDQMNELEVVAFAADAVAGGNNLDEVVVQRAVTTSAAPAAGPRKGMAAKESANDGGSAEEKFVEATVRSDFRDAIYWNPSLKTNAKGEAKANIALPDNLTTWRSTARVITADSKVGQTQAKIVVTKNLLVRMETPRFITLGDELLIATNIHNYLFDKKTVKVSLQADNLTLEGTEQMIEVAANGEQRIDWKVKSEWLTPKAQLTVKALTNEESDAMEIKVPVLPYGLEMVKAQSAYLENNQDATITLHIPASADLRAVQAQLSLAPSVTAALLSSMDQLIGYPYGCVEQTMSRFMPLVVVANTLQNIGTDYQSTISRAELEKMAAQGFKRLGELQHPDGGFGWWEQDQSHPFMTAYVCFGLNNATKAGFAVPEPLFAQAKNALRNQIEINNYDNPATQAYQMMVAAECGMSDLWKKPLVSGKDAYEIALWAQAANAANDKATVQDMVEKLEKLVQQEGAFTYWGGKKFYYSWQDDQVETTANVVRAIAAVQPQHPLLPKAILWLMSKRRGNEWHNTRQTAMIIFGLQEIIKKEVNPDLEVDVWVNGEKVDTRTFAAADVFKKSEPLTLYAQNYHVDKNAAPDVSKYNLLKHGDNHIVIKQKGKGTNYASAKLTYYVAGDGIEARNILAENAPFEVKREYFKLVKKTQKDGSLIYAKQAVGTQNLKSGDEILVKVTVKADNTQEFVLIEDPIAAGCEFIRDEKGYIIEGESNYNYSAGKHGGRIWYPNYNNWYTHREYRDAHLALTITNLGKGEYEYSYLMRAQIPGSYKINPAVAQLMYYPEVRGFSDFKSIKIVD